MLLLRLLDESISKTQQQRVRARVLLAVVELTQGKRQEAERSLLLAKSIDSVSTPSGRPMAVDSLAYLHSYLLETFQSATLLHSVGHGHTSPPTVLVHRQRSKPS